MHLNNYKITAFIMFSLTFIALLVGTIASIVGILFNLSSRHITTSINQVHDSIPPKNIAKYFDALTDGFEHDTIVDKNDIFIIYESANSDYSSTTSFSSFLKRYLVYLRMENPGKKYNTELFNKINKSIKGFIEEEESNDQFEDVPDAERRVLGSLWDSLPTQDRKKLFELADLVKRREYLLGKYLTTNWITIPLSITGVALTILFGFNII